MSPTDKNNPSWKGPCVIAFIVFGLTSLYSVHEAVSSRVNIWCAIIFAPVFRFLQQPDLLVVCDDENRNEKDKYTGVPSLVVEILSESTIRKDLIKKLDLYMHSGIEEYWVVNYFNREVTVYKFADKNYAEMRTFVRDGSVESFIFNGFTADLKDIFE